MMPGLLKFYNMKITVGWNYQLADWEYVLDTGDEKMGMYSGDLLWAQRTANQFNLKLPRPDKE